MKDETEDVRREMLANGQPEIDALMADRHWTTEQLVRDFTVHGFLAPFIVVTRKSDGMKGTLEFTHAPRRYFNFMPD